MPNLNTTILGKLPLIIPPLSTQQVITEILSSLDDKIALLTWQNDTLEALAQAYFRQWFVESEVERLENCFLGDLIHVKYGKDHKQLRDGKIPVYGSGGIMRYADTALYDKESVLIPRKGTLNNVLYVNSPFWSVDTMFYTEMRCDNIAKFVYFFVKDLDLLSMNVGSAVPSMTTNVLNTLPLSRPSSEMLAKFENCVAKPNFQKIAANVNQITILQKLRDTLLPKLFSGEVRVKL
jgi:type I restriction enzyme S subunit